jgi:UDP-glucose 4-epimerase
MLDAARGAGAKKFVLSSSAAVYGDEPVIPSRETDIPAPLSPYAITKLDGEYYCGMYQSEFGLPTAVLRYFNVFGEGQRPDSQYAAAIPAFVSRAIKGSPMTIFGDGGQTRDFVYVGDVVAANVLAAECGSGVYNVARGEKTTILELAQIINQICGGRSTISHEAARAGDVRHSTALTKRIQELGFVPKMELQTGLERTVADLKIRLT